MATRRLGRGLGSLLGTDGPSTDEIARPETTLRLADIRPNSHQPRKTFDAEALNELTASIREHGVLQPIIVRTLGDGAYELIAGERRWRSAKQAGLQEIPALIRTDVSDEQMLELALVENVQRQDLDPMERAEGYRELMAGLDLSQEQVAEKVGLRRSTVANHLRLLELPAEAQLAVRKGLVSMGHARALLGIGRPTEILGLLQRIVREGLSVRQVEDLVRSHNSARRVTTRGGAAAGADSPEVPWKNELEARMRQHLGCKVQIRNGPNFRGEIVIEYYDRQDLDRLSEKLAPRTSL
jgi:ParB family transcriptional regulator, chromosome partitioning protein